MIVNGTSSVQGVYKNYKSKVKYGVYENAKVSDVQDISQKGRDFSFTMEKLKEQDLKRTEKVDNIRKQVQNNTYVTNTSDIARAMLFGYVEK